ncbi:type I-F CRISPR-associated protein Csy1 [Halorhodospira halochloris]|uniref:type I-F CRISPR-associated protein Csy1 n=1 Tax=Halorhodospira halochloris TaxID=1052 RepID=UPI001EE8B05E|nr:type I-F CRISPR-associated protein Csy1 [Halorhodospira halochloris]MCG5549362.1 type I-F CRISPR-associated protein Csy1 [Halorhodospira halochloris]
MQDESVQSLRERISEFLAERLEAKLSGLKDSDPKRATKEQELRQKFQREAWIADAAHRVSQLQVTTHPAKATHPDSKATSLYKPPCELPDHSLVGSHVLGEEFPTDVVGNAAALDVFKFLKLEHDGRTILARALGGETELARAFSDDVDKGKEWVRSFAAVTEPSGSIKADPRLKQLYWLTGEEPTRDGDFHLLAPLYSTILSHRIHAAISHTRFSEESKLARKAYWNGEYSECEHREYPHLAAQKFGGSKPQNISQLNSERGGNNYLLGSLPPNWRSAEVRPLLHTDSALRAFGRRSTVRQTLRELERFLMANPRPNQETRQRRDALVAALVDELLVFAATLQEVEPGWSADPACELPEEEALWLDPERATADPEFAQRRESLDWVSEVSERFAAWLNQRLQKSLPVGDAEHAHWEAQLQRESAALEEALAHA